MTIQKFTCSLVAAFLASTSAAAMAQDAQADDGMGANDIIVTARRSEERLQDVPVAVSVISSAKLEAKGSFNPIDLAQSAPGLNVTASIADRANLTYTIRGQGFSFGTLFPAVITYFNEVPIARLTQGSFFDVANVQVLRGPQGVNFGRVTDGGNVMVTAQTPKNEFGGYVTAKVGNYGLRSLNGAVNIPIVDDKVLLRLAFDTTRRSGFTKNLASGKKLDNIAYEGYRGSLTLRPVEGLENTTVVSYLNTHDNGTSTVATGFNPAAGGLLPTVGTFSFLMAGAYGIDNRGEVVPFRTGLTPWTAPNMAASIQSQLAAQQARGKRTVSLNDPLFSKRKNLYVVNSTTAELSDSIQLKNVFGYVREKEDNATTFAPYNGSVISQCHSACRYGGGLPYNFTEQFSEELRLSGSAIDNRLTWSIGGYMDEQRPAGPSENAGLSIGIIQRVGVLIAKTSSRAAYGSAEFAVTDQLKINAGLRYTRDKIRSKQNTYLSFLDGGQAALKTFLTGPFGGSLDSATADFVVASSFAPIPHGKCELYGVGSILNGATGTPCLTRNATFNATTWQVGASYQTDGGQLFYAKASKGYRPGGVNGTAPPGVDPSYNPETDVSLELGIKADWDFNGVFLRTNLAAYSDRYKAIQKNVVLPGAVPQSLVQNVNNGRIKGIEAEISLIPVEGLTLGGTFAYTHARFDHVDSSGFTSGGAPADPCNPTLAVNAGFCSANRFNSVPKTQVTLSVEYKVPVAEDLGDMSIGALLYNQSSVALNDTSKLNPGSVEGGFTTIDLTANWRNVMDQPVDLGFFVTNVTNKVYRIGTNDLFQTSSVGTQGAIYNAPRMWGFSLKYRFGSDAE
jgi:iron complex outermembrane receptor protein